MQSKPWIAQYDRAIRPHYDYPRHNLAVLLADAAKKYPEQTAIDFYGKQISYSRLLSESAKFANVLRQRGIHKGDRVAIMLPNCPQLVIAFYGVLMTGAIVVQTNPLYKERELEAHFSDSDPEALITLDVLYARAAHVRERIRIRHVFIAKISNYLPFPKNLLYELKRRKQNAVPQIPYSTQIESFISVLRRQPEAAPNITAVNAKEDTAILQYTGGTTGFPKGVMLTHYNLTANTIQCKKWSCRIEDGRERYLAALPFFHVFGMTVLMNQSVYTGGTLLLLPKFETDDVLKIIHKKRPTIFPGAPTMYIALLNHPRIRNYDLSSIKICLSGSAPLPLEVQERFEQLSGGRLIEGYGLSEASPVTHCNNVWAKRKIGSIGLPLPDTEVKIVHVDSGEEVKTGEIGELAVKGPQIMKGYWRREEETAAALREGWLYTGDMAMMDDEGFFSIMDRKKDIIIAGGFNIYPREIEEVLFEHPDVKEAVVIGVPDPYRGETVKAFIVSETGADLDPHALESWCRERMAAYKVPRLYEFRPELPKTFIGRVLRRILLEQEMKRRSEDNDDSGHS